MKYILALIFLGTISLNLQAQSAYKIFAQAEGALQNDQLQSAYALFGQAQKEYLKSDSSNQWFKCIQQMAKCSQFIDVDTDSLFESSASAYHWKDKEFLCHPGQS